MMFAEGAADILQLVMQTYRAKDRYEKIAHFFADGEKPVQTYSAWAPKIDLTTHLIANDAIVSHAAAVPKASV